MKRRPRAPSPALVISLIALFVALGGTTYAATNLPKNSVGTKQLKNNAVTGPKIASKAVTAAKINTSGLSVPSATHATNADSATNATNATHATSADSAGSATNAGKVGGYAANDLTRVAYMSTTATTPLSTTTSTYGGTLSITAPAAGFVLLNGSYSLQNVGCTGNCTAIGQIRDITGGQESMVNYTDLSGTEFQTGSMSIVFPVGAGVNTFDLRFSRGNDSGGGTINGWYAEMNAIYSPFGSTGGSGLAGHRAAGRPK
jgi:hypothetical protein